VPPTIQTNPRAQFIKRCQLAAAKSATLNSATIYICAIDRTVQGKRKTRPFLTGLSSI
jgi:hypothetical protein